MATPLWLPLRLPLWHRSRRSQCRSHGTLRPPASPVLVVGGGEVGALLAAVLEHGNVIRLGRLLLNSAAGYKGEELGLGGLVQSSLGMLWTPPCVVCLCVQASRAYIVASVYAAHAMRPCTGPMCIRCGLPCVLCMSSVLMCRLGRLKGEGQPKAACRGARGCRVRVPAVAKAQRGCCLPAHWLCLPDLALPTKRGTNSATDCIGRRLARCPAAAY